MPTTKGASEIYYETHGPAGGPQLLFIQGFTWQLIGWHEEFCRRFVNMGARVILFDNRDVGLSQKFGGPEDYDGGYDLTDMADDGFRVLDALCIDRAHLVGASMGGMIAQSMALSMPSRVRSLNLIYSAPEMDPRHFVQIGSQDPQEATIELACRYERAAAIDRFVERERASISPGFRYDEQWVRDLASRAFDRCYAPEGNVRQAVAMSRWVATPQKLKDLEMPSSIIHGRDDGRVRVAAALELANYLPNAELHIYPGLGHEIPNALWNEFVRVIMRTVARAR